MESEVPRDDCATERSEDLRGGLIYEAEMAGCADAPRDARTIGVDDIAHCRPQARTTMSYSATRLLCAVVDVVAVQDGTVIRRSTHT